MIHCLWIMPNGLEALRLFIVFFCIDVVIVYELCRIGSWYMVHDYYLNLMAGGWRLTVNTRLFIIFLYWCFLIRNDVRVFTFALSSLMWDSTMRQGFVEIPPQTKIISMSHQCCCTISQATTTSSNNTNNQMYTHLLKKQLSFVVVCTVHREQERLAQSTSTSATTLASTVSPNTSNNNPGSKDHGRLVTPMFAQVNSTSSTLGSLG